MAAIWLEMIQTWTDADVRSFYAEQRDLIRPLILGFFNSKAKNPHTMSAYSYDYDYNRVLVGYSPDQVKRSYFFTAHRDLAKLTVYGKDLEDQGIREYEQLTPAGIMCRFLMWIEKSNLSLAEKIARVTFYFEQPDLIHPTVLGLLNSQSDTPIDGSTLNHFPESEFFQSRPNLQLAVARGWSILNVY